VRTSLRRRAWSARRARRAVSSFARWTRIDGGMAVMAKGARRGGRTRSWYCGHTRRGRRGAAGGGEGEVTGDGELKRERSW